MKTIILLSICSKIGDNPDGIFAVSFLLIVTIAACIPFFTRPRYRIVKVEHRSGEIDYTVQSSRVFGLPGTWRTEEICMGYWTLVLRGCDLKAAKNYVKQFEYEDAKERGYKTKRKTVYVEDSNT